MKYTLKKTILGKYHILYNCPHCSAALDSPADEAGLQITCPTCQQPLTAPGSEELAAIREAEKVAQKKSEEAKQHQELLRQQRKEQERRLAEAERRAAQTAHNQSKEQSRQAPTDDSDVPTFADRFLSVAFAFGKAISVLVVAACFVAIAVCLVWYALVTPERPRTAVPPFMPPTAADYAAAVRTASAPKDSAQNYVGDTDSRARTSSDTFDDILRRYGIDSFELRMAFIRLNHEAQDALLKGLTEFTTPITKADAKAVLWYIGVFRERWDTVQQAKDERNREIAAAAAEAGALRMQLLTGIGMSVAGLMSFLFLPLLIQIEQNTRRLAARVGQPARDHIAALTSPPVIHETVPSTPATAIR